MTTAATTLRTNTMISLEAIARALCWKKFPKKQILHFPPGFAIQHDATEENRGEQGAPSERDEARQMCIGERRDYGKECPQDYLDEQVLFTSFRFRIRFGH